MQIFKADILTHAGRLFAGLEAAGSLSGTLGLEEPVDGSLAVLLPEFRVEFASLGLQGSAKMVDRVAAAVEEGCTAHALGDLIAELRRRFEDEIEGVLFLHIPYNGARFFWAPREGWEGIIARFPAIAIDVEEASKCRALERYSAAVAHSLLVVEIGLIELGTFLNVTDLKSGWTAVAGKLATIMKKRYEDLDDFERENRSFLEQVQGTVEALKNAWRNKVSHAQGRLAVVPGGVFTPEFSEEIMLASRSFMRRLAEELPAGEVL